MWLFDFKASIALAVLWHSKSFAAAAKARLEFNCVLTFICHPEDHKHIVGIFEMCVMEHPAHFLHSFVSNSKSVHSSVKIFLDSVVSIFPRSVYIKCDCFYSVHGAHMLYVWIGGKLAFIWDQPKPKSAMITKMYKQIRNGGINAWTYPNLSLTVRRVRNLSGSQQGNHILAKKMSWMEAGAQ